MLQLISGSTRRKANKCEPLLSRAGKEMELFPACTRAPGSLGRSSVDIWTASLQWDCIIIPEWNSIPRHQVGGGIKSGSGVERVDYWETMTMTFDKQWAKLGKHRGMTRRRGRRRSVSLPPVTEVPGETSETPTRLQQLRQSGRASDRLLAWGDRRLEAGPMEHNVANAS